MIRSYNGIFCFSIFYSRLMISKVGAFGSSFYLSLSVNWQSENGGYFSKSCIAGETFDIVRVYCWSRIPLLLSKCWLLIMVFKVLLNSWRESCLICMFYIFSSRSSEGVCFTFILSICLRTPSVGLNKVAFYISRSDIVGGNSFLYPCPKTSCTFEFLSEGLFVFDPGSLNSSQDLLDKPLLLKLIS